MVVAQPLHQLTSQKKLANWKTLRVREPRLPGMNSFLKWAGGKRWLVPELERHLPQTFNRYVEPFLGGGAVFFALRPEKATLSDINGDLIELYEVVRDSPEELQAQLLVHEQKHEKNYYYLIRSDVPPTKIERAARTLYLNRTCFNGLYRVNKKGEFNVPIGTKTTVVFPNEDFGAYSAALSTANLLVDDFENVIDGADSGDLVYVDPPYTVAHNMNGFLKYNDHIFSWADQERLKSAIIRAAERGVMVIASNANHESVKELYAGLGDHHEVVRHSVIAGPVAKRTLTSEVLMTFNLGK